MTTQYILQILQGMLSPLIAIIATYIAIQQWRTAKHKQKMDLYDRRLKLYINIQQFVTTIIQKADVEILEIFAYEKSTFESEFLFDENISHTVELIRINAIDLYSANQRYCDGTMTPPPGYDHLKVTAVMDEKLKWFLSQNELLKSQFKPFLIMTN